MPASFRTLLCLLFFFNAASAGAQSFYVVSPVSLQVENKTYRVSIENCDTVALYTCPESLDLERYNDIAVDRDSNIWYVSAYGHLYKRALGDTGSCQYIGDFMSGFVSSMVADSAGALYAVGDGPTSSLLFKYDGNGFHTLGSFPPGMYGSGDLFFYEHRLFLTCRRLPPTYPTSFLAEVSLPNPASSQYYMALQNVDHYAAFSVLENGQSKAFVMAGYEGTRLLELDIPNRTIADTVCFFPTFSWGAAAYYERTADSITVVPLPTAVGSAAAPAPVFQVLHPVTHHIRIQTSIRREEVHSLLLTDLSGRLVKSYATALFPQELEVSDLPDGIYLLRVRTTDGHQLYGKVVKESGSR